MTENIFLRKVGRIKKSLYVNIPSKIAKTLDITKGSSLYVIVQDDKVILSKNPEDVTPDTDQSRPSLESGTRTDNEIKKDKRLELLLKDGYEW
ncbi:Putative transcriptional regulator AbrB [Nitrosotalea devaniterrae]|uniref:Transcriptional regulator AbrB n=1 Tax=Nitrosotalea devaniterrae TaxID=1078905 RepID=A0A128A5N5_9ARCH|nr:Putative transcriptional regulator AbrB [Candidatus Nitrosotalea devanaterra]